MICVYNINLKDVPPTVHYIGTDIKEAYETEQALHRLFPDRVGIMYSDEWVRRNYMHYWLKQQDRYDLNKQ